MKLVAWAWSRIETPGERALLLAALLVALPLFLCFLFFWYRAFDTPTPAPVAVVERWIEPLKGASYDTAGFVVLAQQAPDFTAARWEAITLPDSMPLPLFSEEGKTAPLARLWMRARVTPSADRPAPAQPVVYVTRIMGGAWSLRLNGRLIEANLDNWRMQWNMPLHVMLPPGSLTPGQPAVIDIAVPFGVTQGYAFGSIYVGDAPSVNRLFETRIFFQDTQPKTAVLITLLLGLLSLHYWLYEREDHAYLRLAIAAIAWAIGNAMYFGDFLDDDASLWFGALTDAATSWMMCTLALFAMHFDTERWPRLEVGLVAYAVLMTVLTLPVWNWDVYGLSLQYYTTLAIFLAVLGYFTWRAIARGSHEFRVITTAIWSIPLMALHTLYFVSDQRDPDGIEIYPYSAFIVFGMFLYVMQRRYIGARRALVEVNASLDLRLQQRETELAEQHGKLMRAEQERIVQQERQRIMRDMHDGIGTALMSSLVLAEYGELTPSRTATILRESLDELKLVIDSLEPIEEDIATLLAALRYRFGQRIEDAGIKIVWNMAELPPLPWLDPSHALQVLRIVQEALANVIKHARATVINISAWPTAHNAERAGVVVRITDNGIGFDPAHARPGRGLDNMRRRAALLGASLEIHAQPGGGSCVSLTLPFDPPVR